MQEKGKIVLAIWIGWIVTTVAITVRDAAEGAGFGVITAIVLGITTINVLRSN